MRIDVFNQLCARLKTYGLKDSRFVPIQEQVVMFLVTVGHNHRNRCHVYRFFRSGQTISCYYHQVLDVIMRMYKNLVIPAHHNQSPADAGKDRAWEGHFKDAVGPIDGTHFFANVSAEDRARYRDRKGNITWNVLVACTFDLRFTYILASWEGSAHDGRILRCAVNRDGHRLQVPESKYFLADAGYALVPGFLTPYRGVIYHLHGREGRNPENARELYNYRHSSIRMVVVKIIGVLKKRFAYLRSSPFHDICTQSRIVLACCALHNFLREVDPDYVFEVPEEVPLLGPDGLPLDINQAQLPDPPPEPPMVLNMIPTTEWTNKRNWISELMWAEY